MADADERSAYELQRLETMRQNEAKLMALGIFEAKAAMVKPKQPRQPKQPKVHGASPRRASGRLMGEPAPDFELDDDEPPAVLQTSTNADDVSAMTHDQFKQ
eukprot:788263-Prymnesium_polylepis.1